LNTLAARLAVPSGLLLWGTAAAAAAGVIYTSSPSSVWFLVAVTAIAAWAVAGLQAPERRWVLTTLVVAIVLRAAVVSALPLVNDYTRASFRALFPDASYVVRRSLWLRHHMAGVAVAPRDLFEAFQQTYADTAYYAVLAYLQLLVGPAPYGLHLFSATLYLAACVLLFRTIRPAWGAPAAGFALVLLLFVPTLFLWSLSPLREAAVVLLLVVAVASVMHLGRDRRLPRRLLFVFALLLAAAAIGGLRQGGVVMLVAGVGLGLILRAATARASLAIAGVAAVAIACSIGPLGPRVRDRALAEIRTAASRHIGHLYTPGHSYALLDDRYYVAGATSVETLPPREAAKFALASVVRFVTVPEPWNAATTFEAALMPQQVLWYGAVGLAVAGLVTAFRRDALLASLLAGIVLAGVAVIAPNSGNVGTLIRHRDMVAPFVFVLGALGMTLVVGSIRRPAHSRFRRVMSIDSAALVAVAGSIGIAYALYLVFRPPAVEISRLEPDTWRAGETPRVILHGRNLRPFLRALYVRTGETPGYLRNGAFGAAAADYLLRSPESGELEMPALEPATYDLLLFERGQQVAPRHQFTVAPRADAAVRTAVFVSGSFIVDGGDAGSDLVAGTALQTARGIQGITLTRVGAPREDFVSVRAVSGDVPIPVAGRTRIPATLTVDNCVVRDGACTLADMRIAAGVTMRLQAARGEHEFRVDGIHPVVTSTPALDVRLRVVAPVEAVALVSAGDYDLSAGDELAAARVVRIDARAPAPAPGFVSLDVTLRLPPVEGPQGWHYRGQPVRVGSEMTFDAGEYLLRGTVAALSRPRGGS
jgi:hypothetical protein